MNEITGKRLRELLNYDQLTGIFTWKLARRGIKVGVPLGCSNGNGYLRITVDGRSHYAHRLAWIYVTDNAPLHQIDHINGNPSDNRFSNLREATPLQNQQNKRNAQVNSRTRLLGASWHEKAGKWQAHISVNRRRIYLGLFESAEQAHKAYKAAKNNIHEFSTI